MINVADNFSYLGAKPLDGRIKYDTLAAMKAMADSTLYDGCLAYCVATDKTYQWKSTNTVDPDTGKWREFTSGGGTGGGHTIEDPEGTALTQRDTLQFGGDLEVSDDDENEKTVVAPHELTAAELTEIVTPLPSVPVNMPILFDETGTERVVGWYRLANGMKKPVYQKCVKFTVTSAHTTATSIPSGITNGAMGFVVGGYLHPSGGNYLPNNYNDGEFFSYTGITNDVSNVRFKTVASNAGAEVLVIIQYTKTTDTPT